MSNTTAQAEHLLTGEGAVKVTCPVTECTVEGTIPGIRRHIARSHGEHRGPRDVAFNIDHPAADTKYSHRNPTPCRAKTPVGQAHYATNIAPESRPARPLATYKKVTADQVREALNS